MRGPAGVVGRTSLIRSTVSQRSRGGPGACVIKVSTMAIHSMRRRVESHQLFSRRKNLLVWGFALAIGVAIGLALLFAG